MNYRLAVAALVLDFALGASIGIYLTRGSKSTSKESTSATQVANTTDRTASVTTDHSVEEHTTPTGERVIVKHDVVTRTVERQVDRIVTREVEKKATSITAKPKTPDWVAGIGLGLTLGPATPNYLPPPYSAVPVVYQVHVDRHIVGPFYLGAWATSQKSAGLEIQGQF